MDTAFWQKLCLLPSCPVTRNLGLTNCVGYDNLPFHGPYSFDRVTLGQFEGKRSKIGKWYSARASNEGLKDTKKQKAMINVNMKRYEKFYVGGSHNKSERRPYHWTYFTRESSDFYKDFTEETSLVRTSIYGTDRWRNGNGVRQFNIWA